LVEIGAGWRWRPAYFGDTGFFGALHPEKNFLVIMKDGVVYKNLLR